MKANDHPVDERRADKTIGRIPPGGRSCARSTQTAAARWIVTNGAERPGIRMIAAAEATARKDRRAPSAVLSMGPAELTSIARPANPLPTAG